MKIFEIILLGIVMSIAWIVGFFAHAVNWVKLKQDIKHAIRKNISFRANKESDADNY